MDIGLHIKELRKQKKMSQATFGEKLGVSRDVINNLENGRVDISELMTKAICSEFNINEEWLRHGAGEMTIQTDNMLISNLASEYALDSLDQKIIKCYLNLGSLQRKVIKDYLRNLVDAVLSDEIYEEYRDEYIKEYSGSVAARNGDTDKIDELTELYDNRNGRGVNNGKCNL